MDQIVPLWRICTCMYLCVKGVLLLYTSSALLKSTYTIESYHFCLQFLLYIVLDTIQNVYFSKRVRIDSLVHHVWSFIGLSLHIYDGIVPPLWLGLIGLVECITVSRIVLMLNYSQATYSRIRKYLTLYVRIPATTITLLSVYPMSIFGSMKPLSKIGAICGSLFVFSFDLYCLFHYEKHIRNSQADDSVKPEDK